MVLDFHPVPVECVEISRGASGLEQHAPMMHLGRRQSRMWESMCSSMLNMSRVSKWLGDLVCGLRERWGLSAIFDPVGFACAKWTCYLHLKAVVSS